MRAGPIEQRAAAVGVHARRSGACSSACARRSRCSAILNALPYNTEPPPHGATLRSFRGVVRHGTAHCLEAALAAAVILEQHGWPPLVLTFESIDELDHVHVRVSARGPVGIDRAGRAIRGCTAAGRCSRHRARWR